MKTFIALVILCTVGIAYAWVHPFHAVATVSVEKQPNVPSVEVGVSFQLPPTAPAPTAQPKKPTAAHPVARKPAKVWHCNDWRDLTQGSGRVQECEWVPIRL